ncbi:hypothetical protein Tco_0999836 [Tanacetum coccineum]
MSAGLSTPKSFAEVVLMNDEDVSYIVFGYYLEAQEVYDVYARTIIGDAMKGIYVMHCNIKSAEMESSTQHGPVNGIYLGEESAYEKLIVRVGFVKSESPGVLRAMVVQHLSSSESHGQPNLLLPKGKRKLDEYVTVPVAHSPTNGYENFTQTSTAGK